jgi:chromosome segregation ATPase
VSEDLAKALQLAESAAPAARLQTLAEAMEKLQASMPSQEDLRSVKGQLATLQNGMGALDDLSKLRTDVEALQLRFVRVDELRSDLEGIKTDILTNEKGIRALETDCKRLNDSHTELQSTASKVPFMIPNHYPCTSQLWPCSTVHTSTCIFHEIHTVNACFTVSS